MVQEGRGVAPAVLSPRPVEMGKFHGGFGGASVRCIPDAEF